MVGLLLLEHEYTGVAGGLQDHTALDYATRSATVRGLTFEVAKAGVLTPSLEGSRHQPAEPPPPQLDNSSSSHGWRRPSWGSAPVSQNGITSPRLSANSSLHPGLTAGAMQEARVGVPSTLP